MVVLDFRSGAYTASLLSSSFLPKCNLRQAQTSLRLASRPSFHGAVASTKQQQKKKKGGSSSSARGWSHEHIMVLWDEVFEQCCADPVKATHIRDLAFRGLAKHGRGCALVLQKVQTRPRGSGTGFTSKPPRSSRRVPDFITLDYHTVYLPREYLLDPFKAPNEADIASSEEASNDDALVDAAYVEKTQTNDHIIDVDAFLAEALGNDDTSSDDDEPDVSINGAEDSLEEGGQGEEEDDDEPDVSIDGAEDSLEEGGQGEEEDDDETSFFIPYNDRDAAKAMSGSIDADDSSLLLFDDAETPVTTMSGVQVQHDEGTIVNEALFDGDSSSDHVGTKYTKDDGLNVAPSVCEVVEDTSTSKPPESGGLARAGAYGTVVSEKTAELHEGQTGAHASGRNGAMTNKLVLPDWQGGENKEEGQSEEGSDVELVTQQMLFACMRGVDRTRLLSLTANFDFEAPRFRFGRKTAMIDVKTMDAGGEDPYNPDHNELIVLLHLIVDGWPSYGADIVVAERMKELPVDDRDTPPRDGEKPSWKLRQKYSSLAS